MSNIITRLRDAGRFSQAFIDGQWINLQTANHCDVINPAQEAVVANLTLADESHIDLAAKAARKAFASWSQTTATERADLLDRIHQIILRRSEEFAELLCSEIGVAITYARTAHVPFAAEHIRVASDNIRQFPFIKPRGTTAIVKEPIGVCSLITPWNWPLYQVTAKVGPALAAGCTVILKPSELSPLSALLFAEVMAEAGTPPGVFNLVIGEGHTVGASMSSHPDVDMVSITGSTRAGVLVAQAAAPTVKRVAQELGGKSPNVILPDADLDRAVSLGVAACFRNIGQSCSAPTRMLVPRQRLNEAEQLAIAAANEVIVGDPLSEHVTHGSIANRAQFDRIQLMIGKGLEEGAKMLCGGLGRPEGLDKGFFVKPTIFSDVSRDMAIAQEEIFGPVLCILPYDSVEEAIEIANDSIYGLGAHVQGSDLQQARAVAARIRAGQVLINYPAWDPQAPFGGYKQSGSGREFGLEGIEEYLETKAIIGYGE